MRQIRFRGKDIDSGQWVYGNYVKYNENDELIYCIVSHERCKISAELVYIEVASDTIGQFTGLYDSRNAPIYEGDIIQSKSSKHLIGYSIEDARFYCILTQYVGDEDFERCERCGLDQKWINEFGKVVIGNKYDNPELLKS